MTARWSVVLVCVTLACLTTEAAGQRMQVVIGQVLGDSAQPIKGALVSITMAPDRTLRQDTSDAGGRWRVEFAGGTGDYLVHIAASSHTAFRKRVTASALDSIITVDATLKSSVQRLNVVRVVSTRERPPREVKQFLPDGVSAEYFPMGVEGALTPDLQGNFAALAATIPGLSPTIGGVSAFGLNADQNTVTLNGLSFAGASLPRSADVSVSFATSTYDPSRGGFAGVETSVMLSPGDYNTRRKASTVLDNPALQATDRLSRSLGQRVSGGLASVGASGTLVEDVWYYNVAADLSRRATGAPSAVSGDASLFALAGVAPDSITRLLRILPVLGIPTNPASVPSERITDDISLAFRIDHALNKAQSFVPNDMTWALVGTGQFQRNSAVGSRLTALPTVNSGNTAASGALQLIRSSYVRGYSLWETRTGLSVSRSTESPYVRLPAGTVVITSVLPDMSVGANVVSFGGSSRSDAERLLLGWETRSDYGWIARSAHRLKLTADSKVDTYLQPVGGDQYGGFTYASLSDLAANRPSSFARALDEPRRSGGEWTGFLALGDNWRASRTLQVVYGARMEANRFLTAPDQNNALASALGARTDAAPSRVHVSPRFGFSWRYVNPNSGFTGVRYSGTGTRLTPPSGLIRGGIGEFRAAMPTALLSDARAFNGLPSGSQRLSCIGDAVPAPEWSVYDDDPSRVPSSCVDVAGAPRLSDGAPAVRLVDPSFDAPRSWRSNLALFTVAKGVAISLDGSVSLNLNQASDVDLNFSGVRRFTLSDEGRDVFANPGAIVPGTGVLSAVDSRRSIAFGPVLNRRSDMRSLSRQLTIALSPQATASYFLSLSYTLASTTGDARGYDGAAFGDPRTVERSRGDLDVRHRVYLQLGKSLPHGFTVSGSMTASSGLPYTPLVAGDVNGDGIQRDRAFVFNPPLAPDAQMAAGMQSLLAGAAPAARACLASQLGNAAARNSCEAPWWTTASGRIGLANPFGERGRNVRASLSLANPLGGLDLLLHGSSGIHGWGSNIAPDPILLTVRGFDPVEPRFLYLVNPRFGSTSAAQTTTRSPFRVTLDISIDLSPSLARQQVERVMNRGRSGHVGERLSADSIRRRFSRNVRSPYAAVVEEADSLLLTREQLEQLRAGEGRLAPRIDSIWRSLSAELAALGDDYDPGLATRRTNEATEAAWELARREVVTIKGILTPLQYSLAPWIIPYLDAVKPGAPIHIFSMY